MQFFVHVLPCYDVIMIWFGGFELELLLHATFLLTWTLFCQQVFLSGASEDL